MDRYGQFSNFNDQLAAAQNRMAQIMIQMFKERVYQSGVTITSGVFDFGPFKGERFWDVWGAKHPGINKTGIGAPMRDEIKRYSQHARLRECEMTPDMLAYCQEHQSK